MLKIINTIKGLFNFNTNINEDQQNLITQTSYVEITSNKSKPKFNLRKNSLIKLFLILPHPFVKTKILFISNNKIKKASNVVINTIHFENPVNLYKEFDTDHSDDIWCVTYSPNGELIASGSIDTSIHLYGGNPYRAKTFGIVINKLNYHNGYVSSLAFDKTGDYLASGSEDRVIYIFNIKHINKPEIFSEIKIHSDSVFSLEFSPCNNYLASASLDCTAKIFSFNKDDKNTSGNIIVNLSGHSNWITSLSWSPCRNYIATAGADAKALVYLINTDNHYKNLYGKIILVLLGHNNIIRNLIFSSCGDYLLTAGYDNFIIVYNVNICKENYGKIYCKLGENISIPVCCIASNPNINSKDFAFCCKNGIFGSFSLKYNINNNLHADNGFKLTTKRFHKKWMSSICYSPCGNILVTSCSDSKLQIYI